MNRIPSNSNANQSPSRSWRRLLVPFLGAAALGASFAAPSAAQAWWTRTAGVSCLDAGSTSVSLTYSSPNCNNSTASGRHLSCAVPDTNATPKTAIQQFNVHVTESNPNFVAVTFRCVAYRDAVGGKCGAQAATTSTGIQKLNPPSFAEWGLTSNYGYVFVALPTATGVNDACMQGFLTSDVP